MQSERGSGADRSALVIGVRRFRRQGLAAARMNPSRGSASGQQSVLVIDGRRILGRALAAAARKHSSRGAGAGQQSVLRLGLRRGLGLALTGAALLFAGCLGGNRLCGDGIVEPSEECDVPQDRVIELLSRP